MSKTIFQNDNDFDLAVAAGRVEGLEHFGQFGYNDSLPADIEEVVWQGPTAAYTFPSDTGEPVEIVSTSALDTQTIMVQALDSDWDAVSIIVALDGVTPVVLPDNVARVNRLINIDSTETVGTVSLRKSGGGSTFAIMLPSDQISAQVIFSVPRGCNAKIEKSLVTLNRTGGQDSGVEVRFKRRPFGGVFGLGLRFGLNRRGTTSLVIELGAVAPLSEKSDIIMNAKAENANSDVSARVPFTLYKV